MDPFYKEPNESERIIPRENFNESFFNDHLAAYSIKDSLADSEEQRLRTAAAALCRLGCFSSVHEAVRYLKAEDPREPHYFKFDEFLTKEERIDSEISESKIPKDEFLRHDKISMAKFLRHDDENPTYETFAADRRILARAVRARSFRVDVCDPVTGEYIGTVVQARRLTPSEIAAIEAGLQANAGLPSKGIHDSPIDLKNIENKLSSSEDYLAESRALSDPWAKLRAQLEAEKQELEAERQRKIESLKAAGQEIQ